MGAPAAGRGRGMPMQPGFVPNFRPQAGGYYPPQMFAQQHAYAQGYQPRPAVRASQRHACSCSPPHFRWRRGVEARGGGEGCPARTATTREVRRDGRRACVSG